MFRFFRRKPPSPAEPRCFGDYPHKRPDVSAERSCRDCPSLYDCYQVTPAK